ncbi:MAG: hypothetical protein H6736_12645 [Alphaproteobacteria bacterium]|nr:hypothetical protein [Alphaproteobacteria bacterium]MCB9692651.1 hypothetical protein [Alphaproteobacteria bacterium]
MDLLLAGTWLFARDPVVSHRTHHGPHADLQAWFGRADWRGGVSAGVGRFGALGFPGRVFTGTYTDDLTGEERTFRIKPGGMQVALGAELGWARTLGAVLWLEGHYATSFAFDAWAWQAVRLGPQVRATVGDVELDARLGLAALVTRFPYSANPIAEGGAVVRGFYGQTRPRGPWQHLAVQGGGHLARGGLAGPGVPRRHARHGAPAPGPRRAQPVRREVVLIALLLGCSPPTDDEVLLAAWEWMDARQATLEVRGIDWEAQRPVPGAPGDLFERLTAMLAPLDDSHVQLLAEGHDPWTPGVLEDAERGYWHPDIVESLLTDPRRLHRLVLTGLAAPDTAYLWVGGHEPATRRIAEDVLDGLTADRLILDLRDDHGGYERDHLPISERLVSSSRVYGRARRKTSPDTWGPWIDWRVDPVPDGFTGQVVVLTDRWTVSGGEVLLMALGDDVTRVGGTTAGALGDRVWTDLPNGWLMSYTGEDWRDADGLSLEGIGIAPHIPASATHEDLLDGRDPMLEAAIAARGD